MLILAPDVGKPHSSFNGGIGGDGVSKAFQCLSDEERRKKYDLVGSEELVYERRGGAANGMQGFNGFYDADVDAEEIFRNLFFGGMHPANTSNFGGFSFGPRVRMRTREVDNGSNSLRALIQLLPIILILLVNFMPSSEPIYSLSRSYSHDYRFSTRKWGKGENQGTKTKRDEENEETKKEQTSL
ncbi:chaperone protein dnaJ 49-like [Primulina huaijiensis]|uniref:chaperone protein dnaJ 49-like n=1 Tax=Primulina huaijiensis TaxID=1492673 RepID=UPI003CC6FDC6